MVELFQGRSQDTEGRKEREIRVYDLLDELGIEYIRADHEQLDTMEACDEVDKALETFICKNLFLCNRQKTEFYLLLMPGNKPFKTKELSAQINSARLSFASEEFMVKYLDIHPGSVSVMGLMNDKENRVQLLIDKDILNTEFIGCHPCMNTSSLKVRVTDIMEKFLPAVHHEAVYVELTGRS